MKTIIAIRHASNKGKSETLRELAKLLVAYPNSSIRHLNPNPMPDKGDLSLVVEIVGIIIVIESQGDPYTELEKRLNKIIDSYNPDLIFCATRTKGETMIAIERVSAKGYQTIWTSTYQSETNHTQLNKLKAKHLLDLAKEMKLI